MHLRFPREHWKRIRHSNFIERTFGESRRRVKVIGRLPGETTTIRQLQDLRHQLLEPPRQLRQRTAKTAKTKTFTPAA